MKKKVVLLLGLGILFALSLSACFGRSLELANATTVPTIAPTVAVISTPQGEVPEADTGGDLVPEDVPVMPGAYNLDVIRQGTQVNFQVAGNVESAMDFYQTTLPNFGWMATRAPDSSVGAIGTMTRENEATDKLSINFSYNQNGDFTTVQIAVSRAAP